MTTNVTYYEDIKKEVESRSSTSSTSSTGEVLDVLQKYYEENMEQPFPKPTKNHCDQLLRRGMLPETICLAIDDTLLAPRPSAYYLRAILTRWDAAGIRTPEDVERDRLAFAGRMRKKRNPAGNYSQREYKREDFGDDFFVNFNGDEV